MDKDKYPDDWESMAMDCKEAAGWQCEKCGIGHMADGTMGSCLTVHHPNRDPENPEAKLIALCARCHLADESRLRRLERHKNQLNLFSRDNYGKIERV